MKIHYAVDIRLCRCDCVIWLKECHWHIEASGFYAFALMGRNACVFSTHYWSYFSVSIPSLLLLWSMWAIQLVQIFRYLLIAVKIEMTVQVERLYLYRLHQTLMKWHEFCSVSPCCVQEHFECQQLLLRIIVLYKVVQNSGYCVFSAQQFLSISLLSIQFWNVRITYIVSRSPHNLCELTAAKRRK